MSDNIDYKKAFEFLMVAMVAKTLSPSSDNSGLGSTDMAQGRNFAYGDNVDKKMICDKCPRNFMAHKPKEFI